MLRFLRSFTLVLVTLPALAAAQTGRGVRPETLADSSAIAVLVSKDIGGQRWSIRLGLDGDTSGRASGIVTDPNNPNVEPQFVQCIVIDVEGPADDVDGETLVFECQVGPKCPSRTPGTCTPWQDVGEARVPANFFLPPK